MKRIILFGCVFVVWASLSCTPQKYPIVTSNKVILSGSDSVKQIEFDGHEYLIYDGFRSGGICHKVNCKSCGTRG